MKKLTLDRIEELTFNKDKVVLDDDSMNDVHSSFEFLKEFSKDKIIYGINTGFGPMAQFRIDDQELNGLQYNLIRSHASGAGSPLNETYARSVLVARLNAFLQGNSGISKDVVDQLVFFLNKGVVPEILEHGSVGASGDLVQLAHLGLNLIGEGSVYERGIRRSASEVLKEKEIEPLKLNLRDGLGLINGTSCMTGIGAVNLIYAYRLLDLSVATSAMINEMVEAFDDSFSKELNETKLHPGQSNVAEQMRTIVSDSNLIRKREELFEDNAELQRKEFRKKIQEYYSIRCVPQILGPISDTLDYVKKVIENEVNSTNDNPVVRPDKNNVFHGGNFHGDYISLEMDKLKIAITKLSVLAERQLNFLLNQNLNGQFPPFLNAGKLGFNFGFQGIQYTATSTVAENQSLCSSVYVHSIPNNNDNQDVVSMGTNSAIIAKRVIDNTFQVMAVHIMAVCQAADLLDEGKFDKLSSSSKELYNLVRSKVDFITDDVSQSEKINDISEYIKENSFLT
tara:strand:+ start:175 stop:1704 length:1530 start_codon:yes stop_codon:yes gene_type:complete